MRKKFLLLSKVATALIFLAFCFPVPLVSSSESPKTRGVSVVAKDHSGSSSRIPLYNRMIAVIIGIDVYQDLPPKDHLSYAVKDAKGVETVLQKDYQFDRIISLYNGEATRDNIMRVLQGELANTDPQDAVFVYFAGHGVTRPIQTGEGELGYLIPYDGSLDRVGMHRNISMQQIKADICPLIPAKHVFFVMDACFGGLLLDQRAVDVKFSHDGAYLREITGEQVRQILTAGQANETVLDGGPRGHSVFTGRFIEALEQVKDYVTARELINRLSKEVYGDAATRGHTQRPRGGEVYGTGDFVFVSNYGQRLQDSFLAAQTEVKSVRKRKERLASTYARLLNEEADLKHRLETLNSAAEKRQIEREKAVLEAKKRAHEMAQARAEEELKNREALQAELEKQLQEQAKIHGTIRDLEKGLVRSFQEIEEKKRLEIAAIQRDKETELLRVKRLTEEIQKKRESLQSRKLETLSIGDAMQEYKNVKQQLVAASSKYDEHLAVALKDLETRYENQSQRYEAEVEKLDKALQEYDAKISAVIQKYYSNPPKKDMFETQAQFQQRLATHKKQAEGQAATTRKNFESSLKSIKAQRETLYTVKTDLANQREMEKRDLQDKILSEKEKEMAIYKEQLDEIMNQTYTRSATKVELGKYSPEHQIFPVIASIQINNQSKKVFSRVRIPANEARVLWNSRDLVRGEAVLKFNPASNGLHVISFDLIDDVQSKKYSCNDIRREVGRDGRFIAFSNGIVVDTSTGLEWKASFNKDTNWNEAKSWVLNLNLDGGGWRMPTMDELEALYKDGKGKRNMTPLLKTTGWWVWSGETKSSSGARTFYFRYGDRTWNYRGNSFDKRAFAVRSRSDG
jgi:uncharacterized caspase-like protein